MSPDQAIEIARAALMLMLTIAGPMLIAALIVGVAIGLLQALTQVQEMTLTFVPKIVVILIVMATTGSFTGAQIFAFTERVYGRIERGF